MLGQRLRSYGGLLISRKDPAGPGPLGVIAKEVTLLSHHAVHHPFHPRTEQRIREFDPSKLHIAVKAPKKLSKYGLIRKRVIRRCRAMLFEALKEKGYNFDGTRRVDDRSPNLKGCYMVITAKEQEVINASTSDILNWCRHTVNYFVKSQDGRRQAVGRARSQDSGA